MSLCALVCWCVFVSLRVVCLCLCLIVSCLCLCVRACACVSGSVWLLRWCVCAWWCVAACANERPCRLCWLWARALLWLRGYVRLCGCLWLCLWLCGHVRLRVCVCAECQMHPETSFLVVTMVFSGGSGPLMSGRTCA